MYSDLSHLRSLVINEVIRSFSLWDVPEAYRQTMPPSAALTRGSGLHCDCNARWIKDWILERGLNDITCATPTKLAGVMVTQLKERDFSCGKFKFNITSGEG